MSFSIVKRNTSRTASIHSFIHIWMDAHVDYTVINIIMLFTWFSFTHIWYKLGKFADFLNYSSQTHAAPPKNPSTYYNLILK